MTTADTFFAMWPIDDDTVPLNELIETAIADLSVYSAFRASGETVFLGYDALQTESRILGLIVDGQSVDQIDEAKFAELVSALKEDKVQRYLKKYPDG